MLIFTSNFRNPLVEIAAKMGFKLVSIARWMPKDYGKPKSPADVYKTICTTLPDLAPSKKIHEDWQRRPNPGQYSREYLKQIAGNEIHIARLDLIRMFEADPKTPGIILLCWEKPGAFCHRHIVAQRLNELDPQMKVGELTNRKMAEITKTLGRFKSYMADYKSGRISKDIAKNAISLMRKQARWLPRPSKPAPPPPRGAYAVRPDARPHQVAKLDKDLFCPVCQMGKEREKSTCHQMLCIKEMLRRERM